MKSFRLLRGISHYLIIPVIFIFYIIVSQTGCSPDRDKKTAEPKEFTFKVDSLKLGAAVTDTLLNLRFNPPAGWNTAPKDTFNKIAASSGNQSRKAEIILHPRHIFIDENSTHMLSVTEVQFSSSERPFSEKAEIYRSYLSKKLKASNLKSGEFLKSGMHFIQFVIQQEEQMDIRLLFENKNGKVVQFDYYAPLDHYESGLPAIESSIGSIYPDN